MPDDKRQDFLRAASEIVERSGFDPDYYFVEDNTGDVPYYFYTKETSAPDKLIYVEDGYSNPVIREISEVSAAVRGLQKGYQIHRVCFPPEVKDEIARLYHQ